MNGDTADGPTLGEAYWPAYIARRPGLTVTDYPYSDLDEETRHAVEAGAAAAGAAAIARLNQPAVTAERDELRELLDEIGVLAANAPEDGDSFGLLEVIAMRIAAIGVPEREPLDEWPDPDNPVTGRTPGAAPELAAVRALDIARDEITSVRNVLARVLGEFKRSGSGHSARLGQMTIARAYRDGGLQVPDDLAGLGTD